ncbi:MAG: cbb3-type cytochrome c oxidase N-terminal domain-containing protein [Saprospiraceae bacterium]
MTFRKILITSLSVLFALPIWSQIEGDQQTSLDWAVQNIVVIMGATVIIGACFALYKSMKVIWMGQNISALEASGMKHEQAVKTVKQDSFLNYMYRELAGGVPLEQEADILLNHNYDGIQELDNNMPPWWVGMFYASIIFSFVYIFVYHFSDIGVLQAEEYQIENRNAEIAIAAFNLAQKEAKEKEKSSGEKVEKLVALTDLDKISVGKETFVTFCAACHGKLGEGMVGLGQNLTDEYWIHGGGIENMVKTISNGVPSTTMIPWKTSLSEQQILEVASFILTLQGSNPPNAREPEGEKWKEE